ncbi:hypothetical protein [Neobacillus sp. SAB-20_R2A]|uniref:hypothetical protein n=1 Tax=Neobacillus sp. SAB-20_R2A TaxID=3120519 RepID=UPI003C6E4B86
MLKEVASWSKDDTPNLIGRKKVDWSIFEHGGTTVPNQFYEHFKKANNGIHIGRGERVEVRLVIQDKLYKGKLRNVNRNVPSDTIQILYGKELKDYFKEVFHSSFKYLKIHHKDSIKKIIPQECAEFIEFYETGEPFNYKVNLITKSNEEEKLGTRDEGLINMRIINNKSRPGICYSNVSLIKKALLQNPDHILPYPEILLYLKKNWTNLNSTTEEITRIVDLALNAPKSYFKEVEDGLWGIKDKIDGRLNHIYEYMNPRKIPLRIPDMKYRLRVYEPDDVLMQLLLSDIRFSQIENTAYWVLSEWVIINNLVYDYIYNTELLNIEREKVVEKVIQLHKLDREKAIYLPQFDDRFTIYGNKIGIKRSREEDLIINVKEKLEIPIEISEEIGRLSYKIIHYIKERDGEVSTQEIAFQFFNAGPNDPSYLIYYVAIEELLQVVPEIKQIEESVWKYSDNVPNLNLEKTENVYYAVRDSSPTIQNVDKLKEVSNQMAHQMQKENVGRVETKGEVDRKYVYHTVSYYDRVKGYFSIPNALIEMSVLFRQNDHGKVMIKHEDSRYEWLWEKSGDKYFFYGDGVMDLFSDYLIEPGHRFRFDMDKQVMFLIHLHNVGFDERYASEQQRFLDIGRLVEESKSVNKSIFSLMCEVLAVHPSGMHWSVLQDKVSELRSTTRNTITNMLSKNECFEQVEGKKGYWRLNISKLSRYYINEENEKAMDATDPVQVFPEVKEEELLNVSSKAHPEENRPIENENNRLHELQQLSTQDLIIQIQDKMKQIRQDEMKFKESISEMVKEHFMIGNISAIEDLYQATKPNIKFFERVGNFVIEQERKSEE